MKSTSGTKVGIGWKDGVGIPNVIFGIKLVLGEEIRLKSSKYERMSWFWICMVHILQNCIKLVNGGNYKAEFWYWDHCWFLGLTYGDVEWDLDRKIGNLKFFDHHHQLFLTLK